MHPSKPGAIYVQFKQGTFYTLIIICFLFQTLKTSEQVGHECLLNTEDINHVG